MTEHSRQSNDEPLVCFSFMVGGTHVFQVWAASFVAAVETLVQLLRQHGIEPPAPKAGYMVDVRLEWR